MDAKSPPKRPSPNTAASPLLFAALALATLFLAQAFGATDFTTKAGSLSQLYTVVFAAPLVLALYSPTLTTPPVLQVHLLGLAISYFASANGERQSARHIFPADYSLSAMHFVALYGLAVLATYYTVNTLYSGNRSLAQKPPTNSDISLEGPKGIKAVVALIAGMAAAHFASKSPLTSAIARSVEWICIGGLVWVAASPESSKPTRVTSHAALVLKLLQILSGGLFAHILTIGGLYLAVYAFNRRGGNSTQRLIQYASAAAVTTIALVALQGAKTEFRAKTWSDNTTTSSDESLKILTREIDRNFFNNNWQDGLEDGATALQKRLNSNSLLAYGMNATPRTIPHWEGGSYVDILYKFIPRAIWPNKPTATIGNQWAQQYNLVDNSDRTTSINLPIPVEAYLNFGWLGALPVGAIVGALFASWTIWYRSSPDIFPIRCAQLGTIAPALLYESNLTLLTGGILYTLATYAIITRFNRR